MTQETKTPPSLGDYTEEMRACAEAIDLAPSAIVRPEDRWTDLNGIRFHYLDWGNERLPHLVLLHGGSLTAHTWDMASLLLRDRYHVVALDQRGHGGYRLDARGADRRRQRRPDARRHEGVPRPPRL